MGDNNYQVAPRYVRDVATAVGSLAVGAIVLGSGTLDGRVLNDAHAQQAKPVAYQLPSTAESKYLGQSKADVVEEIPGPETLVRFYETQKGTRFATLTIVSKAGKERIYGFNVDTNGQAPFEFSLIDLNGDGTFSKIPYGKFEDHGWIAQYHNRSRG